MLRRSVKPSSGGSNAHSSPHFRKVALENFFIVGGFKMPDVSKTREELKLNPERLQKLAEAELQARETLSILPDKIQQAYRKQLKMLSDEVDRLTKV